jgi:hypothetical protein
MNNPKLTEAQMVERFQQVFERNPRLRDLVLQAIAVNEAENITKVAAEDEQD